jgi:hypothetical protein
MQHLEGSGTPVLYIGRTDLKINYRANLLLISHTQLTYLLHGAFTFNQIYLLATTKASVFFLYSMYASVQYINIISINQNLICTI